MRFAPDATVMLLLKRGIRRGLLTLRRERGWGTSLLAVLGIVLLVQLFAVACLGVQGIDHLLRTQTALRLPMLDNVSDRQKQEFLIAAQLQPGVLRATYDTREQAYERERAGNPDLIGFLEQSNIRNPFHDTVSVTLRTLSAYDAFVAFVKQPQWRRVVDPAFLAQADGQERDLRQMLRLTNAGGALAFLFLSLAGGILLFAIVELVRRRAFLRREEVFVERMSGAQEASVVLPFATEAAVLLFIAIALSVLLLFAILVLLPTFVSGLASGAWVSPLRSEIAWRMAAYGPSLLIAEVLCVPLIGFLGAYVGTRGQRMTLANM